MSLSKFLSGSSGSGRSAEIKSQFESSGLEASHIEQVRDKLHAHPDYTDCSESELDELALRLTKPEELIKYFSSTTEGVGGAAVLAAVHEPAPETQREVQANQARTQNRLGAVADLPVKLILSKINVTGSRFVTPIARMFEMEYGPLHASLQVGDQILEWNTTSLVIPHGRPIQDQLIKASIEEHKALPPQLPEQLDREEQVDLVFRASEQKALRLERLVEIIARYNSYNYYHPIIRNCQKFVCDAAAAMGYQDPPQLHNKLNEYLEQLKTKKKGNIPNFFETHEELDAYVSGKMSEFSQQDMEYFLCHYFQFHIASKTESKDPESWVCESVNCQCNILETKLDKKSLLLNHFLRARKSL